MTTAIFKINIPIAQAKRLKKVDIDGLFQNFIEDYLEYESDERLRAGIRKNSASLKKTARKIDALL